MSEYHRKLLKKHSKNILLELNNYIIDELNDEIKELEDSKKRLWVRKWISRRNMRGASALLLNELRTEDPQEYRLCLRLTPDAFDRLLKLILPVIQRSDTLMREAIPARIKLEITLNFLATGNSYRSLQHMFRVPKCTISGFLPNVCDAIFNSLKDFIKVCRN